MKVTLITLILGVVFLFLFYVFSYQVKLESFKQINFDITVRLQDKIPSRMDEIFEDMSYFVSPVMSIGFVGLLTVLLFVGIKERKIYPGALLIPLFFGLMIGVEIYGKARVESPAPPFFMLKNPTTIFPKYHVQEAYSYPSGHAARSLFFAGLLSYYFLRMKKKILFVFSVTVTLLISITMSIGKVYLGHHWLTDIVGGWIIAAGFLSFAVLSLRFNINLSFILKKVKHDINENKLGE